MLTFCCCSYYYTLYRYIILHTLLYIEKKQKQAEGKEEREPGRRMPPPSSPVPRLSSALSAVFTVCTISSRSPLRPLLSALRDRDEVAASSASGRCNRHHIATTSPPIDQQPATTGHRLGLSAILPASSSSPPSGGEGRSASQGGRSPPAHPVGTLYPAGVRPNICGHLQRGAEIRQTYQGGGRCRTRLKVLGKNYKAVSL